jgi:membrane-associated protease RseP (regulator of RpoE activity)
MTLSKPLVPGVGPSELRLALPDIFYIVQRALKIVSPGHGIASLPLSKVYLHPTAIAAWVGMFATALNLLPSGQLDGGHIVYAVAPRAHRAISWLTVILLVFLGWMYPIWRVWAGLLFVMNVLTHRQRQAPKYPLLPASRWPLALLAGIMLALTFTVSPFQMLWR